MIFIGSQKIQQTMEQEVQTDVAPETESTNTLPIMTNETSSLITPNSEMQEESVSVQTKEDSETIISIYYLPSNSFSRMCQSENRSSKTTEAWMESAYMPLDRPKVVMSVGTIP